MRNFSVLALVALALGLQASAVSEFDPEVAKAPALLVRESEDGSREVFAADLDLGEELIEQNNTKALSELATATAAKAVKPLPIKLLPSEFDASSSSSEWIYWGIYPTGTYSWWSPVYYYGWGRRYYPRHRFRYGSYYYYWYRY